MLSWRSKRGKNVPSMINQYPDPELKIGFTIIKWIVILGVICVFNNPWQVECALAGLLAVGRNDTPPQRQIAHRIKGDTRDESLGKMKDVSVPIEEPEDPSEFIDADEEIDEEGTGGEPDKE